MRIAVLSDIHGNLPALEAVLADIHTRGVDRTVNLGDCVTSPLWPRETWELLETLNLPTVRGNHDRWLTSLPAASRSASMRFTREALRAEDLRALSLLPGSLWLEGDVLAVHGTPRDDAEYFLEEAVDGRLALARPELLAERAAGEGAALFLCGHSHVQHAAAGPGGSLIVNPGSVGCPRYADNADPWVAEAGSPHARYAVITRRAGRWSVDLVVIEYDWCPVAERARANGRPDFAQGFLR